MQSNILRTVLLVGLGNPGAKYTNTRHNVGFRAVERIATHYNCDAWTEHSFGDTAEFQLVTTRVVLFKPSTPMNKSGTAIAEACEKYQVNVSNVLVVHDELDLQPGTIRIKLGGSNGGHRGLNSTTEAIGNDYSRIRLGVGHPGNRDAVHDYVLSDFATHESDQLALVLDTVAVFVSIAIEGANRRFIDEVNQSLSKIKAVPENGSSIAPHNDSRHDVTIVHQKDKNASSSALLQKKDTPSLYESFRRERKRIKHRFKKNRALRARKKSGAKFIAVTGSKGKTTTVALLSHILSG